MGKCFIAFSIRENLMKLMKFSPSEDSIGCINGIKVLAALWIIIGHRMDMMIENPDVMSLFMGFGERMILSFARMFTSVVDTFFVASGILVTRKCFRLFQE
jgi:peptidoglycan/LPS O-acetylase OafA/YrhL